MSLRALPIALPLLSLLALPGAAQVTSMLTYDTTGADPGLDFGIVPDTDLTATVIFNQADVNPLGDFSLPLDALGRALSISYGSLSLTSADDDLFGSGFPELLFTDGDIVGLDFEDTVNPGFQVLNTDVTGSGTELFFLDNNDLSAVGSLISVTAQQPVSIN